MNEVKPIIFTANYSLKELIEDRGMAKRSVDRIMEMCEILKLNGESYRRKVSLEREKLF
jgi:DNA replication protein DnaC